MKSKNAYVHKIQAILKEHKQNASLVKQFFISKRKLEAKKLARLMTLILFKSYRKYALQWSFHQLKRKVRFFIS